MLVPNANPLVRPSNYALDFAETDKIKVDVTGGALALVWNGTAGNNKWDINTTADWRNPSNLPDVFFNNDAVTFDDAAAVKTVELDAVVQPASIKITTNGGTYTIQDAAGPAGSIAGGTGIDMTASTNATLIVAAELQNSGPTSTGFGNTLQVGIGGTVGRLGPGDINNDGTLIFNRSDALAVANAINGSGGVRQNGTGTLTLSAANGYGGGLTVNSGTARLTNATAGGFGTTTVNSAGTLVVSAAHANPIVLNGGALGATGGPTLSGDLTVNSASTVLITDPQNLTTNSDVIVTGTLNGSGNISLQAGTNNANPDAGPGLRLRGTGGSTYSGTITAATSTKVEMQTSVEGPFSPAGTGKFVLTGGTAALGGSMNGTYSQLLLRNNSLGNTVLGNNVEITGTGMTMLNMLGSAPQGSAATLGNLRIGGGQILGVTKTTGPVTYVTVFDSVTLTGGDATFAPRIPNFGAATVIGSDLALGTISETAPSGVVMNGLATLIFQGAANYSGSTTVSNGTLRLASTGTLNNNAPVTVANGATFAVEGTASVGPVSGDGTTNVLIGGQLTASHVRQGSFSVSGTGSKATIRANGGNAGTSVVGTLDLNPGGQGGILDLKDNDLIVRATAATKDTVHTEAQADIVTAQNGLDANLVTKWDGPGLTSSTARAANVAQGFDLTGLGVIINSDLDVTTGIPNSSYTTFSGQSVTPDDILVKYTYIGDANLSGAVSFDDYVGMDNAFFELIPNLGWATGDINFDGVINFDDYSKVDQAFFFQGAPLSGEGGVAAVPEPGTWLMAILGFLAGFVRWRHRRDNRS